MSLIEKWDDAARKNHALVDAHGTGEKTAVAQAMGAAYLGCLTDLRDACTPRAPKAKWFGAPFDDGRNPTGKWDSWWFSDDNGILRNVAFHRGHYCQSCGQQYHLTGTDERDEDRTIEWDSGAKCIPVVREGFPAPVGWHVVGG